MWMVNEAAVERARLVDFAGARDEGLAHIEEIVQSYQDKIPMPITELRNYLTENIVFHVDEQMEKGLRLYFELAFKHGLIEEVKPLRFI
jgi:chorismate dehydratase